MFPLIYFCLCCLCSQCQIKKKNLAMINVKELTYAFFLGVLQFQVLGSKSSLTPLWTDFYVQYSIRAQFDCFICNYLVFPKLFFEETFLSWLLFHKKWPLICGFPFGLSIPNLVSKPLRLLSEGQTLKSLGSKSQHL